MGCSSSSSRACCLRRKPACDGTLNSQDYNLIRTTTGCTLTGLIAHNKTNLTAPQGALSYNRGPTPIVAL